MARLSGLLTGCPFPPKYFHFIEVGDRKRVLGLERMLQKGLSFFHSSGEWFCFNPRDEKEKAIFNETLRQSLRAFGINVAQWEKVDVDVFRELNRKSKARAMPYVMSKAVNRKAQAEARRVLKEYRFGLVAEEPA